MKSSLERVSDENMRTLKRSVGDAIARDKAELFEGIDTGVSQVAQGTSKRPLKHYMAILKSWKLYRT
jgi:hypothetical protein